MKTKITNILQQLIGFELSRTTRAASMECLKFGTLFKIDHKGIERQIGEFGLHLQCPWRFSERNNILVGDTDLYEQPNDTDEYDENFNWDVQGGNLRDVKLENLLKTRKFIIENVVADELGGFEILFKGNVKLVVFPTLTTKSQFGEYWRLIDNRCIESKHFVVGTLGISEL